MATDKTKAELFRAYVMHPSMIEGADADAVRALLAWNDRNGDFGPNAVSEEDARTALVLVTQGSDLRALYDRMIAELATLPGCEPVVSCGELAALCDPKRHREALGMIDDYEARIGLSAELCEALRDFAVAAADDTFGGRA